MKQGNIYTVFTIKNTLYIVTWVFLFSGITSINVLYYTLCSKRFRYRYFLLVCLVNMILSEILYVYRVAV